MYICSECHAVRHSISALCTHLQIIHSFNVLSIYTCAQDGCSREYQSIKSFRKHMRTKHPIRPHPRVQVAENALLAVCENINEINHNNAPPNGNPQMFMNEDVPNNLQGNDVNIRQFDEITVLNFQNILYESSLAVSAKLYDDISLNRTQVQNILEYVKEFASSGFLEILKTKTFTVLRDNNVPLENIEDLDTMFALIHNMFSGFETETQRVNALEQCHCYVGPKSYIIGVSEKMKKIEGNLVLSPVELTAQFISMKRTLKQFLELPGVFNAIMSNVENLKNSELFTNVIQSPLWRNMERNHFENRIVLPLDVYFDDVEPDNQTGSHSGDHSLGIVYYRISCIPQHLLSLLENIFVGCIFLSDHRKGHNREIFTSIIDELKDLETNGIVIQTEAEYTIYFALCQIIGDNLGLHAITGFVESFNADYYCRFCKEHKNIMRRQLRENIVMIRNRLNYEEDVLINNVSQTGIKTRCIWHALNSYHVTENLVCDLMHDFYEGVCHYDLCAILDYLINHVGFLNLETLNDCIQNFDYGDSGDKPSLITADRIHHQKLKMSASEMMFFVHHFGLMIGGLVPEHDEVWRLYIVLAKILDIVTAPYVRQQLTEYLSVLIAEHHEIYCRLFNKTLKPKHHFMVHYPRIMNLIGPMINVWSMRFEGKHRPVIKRVADNMNCRKNLPLSIAKRYALSCCARILNKRGFSNNIKYHPKERELVNCENFEMFQNILPDEWQQSLAVEEAVICGTCYKSNMVLVFNYKENLPIFGNLCWIVKSQNRQEGPFFVLSGLRTVGFNEHLHSYEITPTPEWFLIEYKNLVSFYPSTARVGPDGNTYVTFRHVLEAYNVRLFVKHFTLFSYAI